MLLAMVVALVILPFLLTMAVNMAVQTAKRKARFRLLRRSINPRFQPLYEPASGEIESLLFTLQGSLGAAVIFISRGIAKVNNAVMTGLDRLSYQSRWVHVAPQRKFCCGWR